MVEDGNDGDSPSLTDVVIRIVRVPSSGQMLARFLGCVRGMRTHWDGERSHACKGQGKCPAKLHNERSVWKGYAPVEVWITTDGKPYWLPAVLEITEALNEVLPQSDLRGESWIFWRKKGVTKRVECFGEYLESVHASILRNDVSPVRVVCRMYATAEIVWDVDPPLPPRQVLLIKESPAPNLPNDKKETDQVNQEDSPERRKALREEMRRAMKGDANGAPPSNGKHEQTKGK